MTNSFKKKICFNKAYFILLQKNIYFTLFFSFIPTITQSDDRVCAEYITFSE